MRKTAAIIALGLSMALVLIAAGAAESYERGAALSAAARLAANLPTPTTGAEQMNQCIDPKGSLDQTIKACTASIQWMTAGTGSPHESLYERRGSAYYEKGDYDLAIADFTEAIHLNPMYGDAYYDRGEAYEGKRDYRRAIDDFTKAFVSGKTSAASRIGQIYTETRDYRLALQWFREGAEKGDANAMAMIGAYYAALITPDCDSARNWIKKAIAAGREYEKKEYAQWLRSGVNGRCHWQE